MDAFSQAALSFSGQNVGAGKLKRVNRIVILCLLLVTGTGLVLGIGCWLLGPQLLSIYSTEADVISFGMLRLETVCMWEFLGGMMGVMVGTLRGLGASFVPMAITISFVCGFRVVWLFTVFAAWPQLTVLYASYPITWGLAAVCDLLCFFLVRAHVKKKLALKAAGGP